MVLTLADRCSNDNEKATKLRQMQGLTQMLHASNKREGLAASILSSLSIESLRLGEIMQDISQEPQQKMVVAMLGSAILTVKPSVSIASLFGDSSEARDALIKIGCTQ